MLLERPARATTLPAFEVRRTQSGECTVTVETPGPDRSPPGMRAAAMFGAAEAAAKIAIDGLLGDLASSARLSVKSASVRQQTESAGPVTAAARVVGNVETLVDRVQNEGAALFAVEATVRDTDRRKVAELRFDWLVRVVAA